MFAGSPAGGHAGGHRAGMLEGCAGLNRLSPQKSRPPDDGGDRRAERGEGAHGAASGARTPKAGGRPQRERGS